MNGSGIIARAVAGLCACVFAAGAAPAAAQAPNLELVPKVGMSMPLGTFADNTELDFAFALGLGAELVLPALPFSVRANLEHARRADIVERSHLEPVVGSASVLALTGAVVIRPLPATAIARPYFMGGAGIRRFDVEVPAGETTLLPGITTRAAFHIGGGFDVLLGPLALVLEVSDYIGTFPEADGGSRLQHHVFGMIGFRVAMF